MLKNSTVCLMNFGIIADGNRRWARGNNKSLSDGHYQGFLVLKDILLPTIRDEGSFDSVTIYGFSTENWKRNPLEVINLMKVFSKIFTEFTQELIENKARFIHAGRKDRLPKKLLVKIENLEEKTKEFTEYTIYLCLDYGGQDEVLRTFERMSNANCRMPIKNKVFEKNLEVPPLDAILRTGGEHRLSNFCIWQAAYAELFFTEKKLPELTKSDVTEVIEEFKNRKRRKGS